MIFIIWLSEETAEKVTLLQQILSVKTGRKQHREDDKRPRLKTLVGHELLKNVTGSLVPIDRPYRLPYLWVSRT